MEYYSATDDADSTEQEAKKCFFRVPFGEMLTKKRVRKTENLSDTFIPVGECWAPDFTIFRRILAPPAQAVEKQVEDDKPETRKRKKPEN
jgi:hypothetical protein